MSRSFTKNTSNIIALTTRSRLHNLLEGARRVTWCCWIYPRSVGGTSTTSDSFWATAVSSSSAGLVGKLNTNRQIGTGGRAAGGDTYAPAYSTGAIPLNRWSHVAAVMDIEQDRVRFYINGVFDSDVAHTWSTATGVVGGVTSGTERIGARSNASTTAEQFDGLLAQLAFWRRELSADEILEVARGLAPSGLQNGLAAYFPLAGVASPERSLVSDVEATITGSIPVAEDPPLTRMRARRSANDWIAAITGSSSASADIVAAARPRTAQSIAATAGAATAAILPANRARSAQTVQPTSGAVSAAISPAILTRSAQAIQAATGAVQAGVSPAARDRSAQAVQPQAGEASATVSPATRVRDAQLLQAAVITEASITVSTRTRSAVAVQATGGGVTAAIAAASRVRDAQAIQTTAGAITLEVTAALRARSAQSIQPTAGALLAPITSAERSRTAQAIQATIVGLSLNAVVRVNARRLEPVHAARCLEPTHSARRVS